MNALEKKALKKKLSVFLKIMKKTNTLLTVLKLEKKLSSISDMNELIDHWHDTLCSSMEEKYIENRMHEAFSIVSETKADKLPLWFIKAIDDPNQIPFFLHYELYKKAKIIYKLLK